MSTNPETPDESTADEIAAELERRRAEEAAARKRKANQEARQAGIEAAKAETTPRRRSVFTHGPNAW